MSSNRAIFITIVLISIALKIVTGNHYLVGKRQPNDHLITQEHVKLNPQPYDQGYQVAYGDNSRITYVSVVDNNLKNNASVRIKSGGLDAKQVILDFQATKNNGMDFSVEIYGVYEFFATRSRRNI